MPTPTAQALGLPAIFELIGIGGAFPAEVKKQELKRPPLKLAEAKSRYARLDRMIGLLRGQDAALRVLRELYGQIPKLALPEKKSEHINAVIE